MTGVTGVTSVKFNTPPQILRTERLAKLPSMQGEAKGAYTAHLLKSTYINVQVHNQAPPQALYVLLTIMLVRQVTKCCSRCSYDTVPGVSLVS